MVLETWNLEISADTYFTRDEKEFCAGLAAWYTLVWSERREPTASRPPDSGMVHERRGLGGLVGTRRRWVAVYILNIICPQALVCEIQQLVTYKIIRSLWWHILTLNLLLINSGNKDFRLSGHLLVNRAPTNFPRKTWNISLYIRWDKYFGICLTWCNSNDRHTYNIRLMRSDWTHLPERIFRISALM